MVGSSSCWDPSSGGSVSVGVSVCLITREWHKRNVHLIEHIERQGCRCKVCDITPDLIISKSGTSLPFLLLPEEENYCNSDTGTPEQSLKESITMTDIYARIKKVISGFAKCFVLFSSSHDAASSMDGYNDLVLRLGDEPGVSLFFADSPQACLPMAMSIAQNHPGRNSLLTGRAPVTEVINWQHCPDKVVFNMLASIPGIGTHSAFALAEAFGSLKHISSASMAEILDKTDLSGSQAAQVVRIFKGSAPAPLDGPFAWPVDGSVDGPVRGAVDD